MSEPLESALSLLRVGAGKWTVRLSAEDAAVLLAEIERLREALRPTEPPESPTAHDEVRELRAEIDGLQAVAEGRLQRIGDLERRPTREQALRAMREWKLYGFDKASSAEDCLDAAMREDAK